ncbi:MAG: ABC transporter permease [Ruminococcus sp.]|nr:ABC transporter permease [Ruminococcus sp.]
MSILVIVMLGSGFFTGLKATMPDMIDTAAEYFEENNLADLTLKSSYGVKYEDIEALKELDDIKGVMAGYSKDVYYSYEGNNLVLKAISYNDNPSVSDKNVLNKLVVSEGRLPENSGECVVEQKLSSPDTFEVGETITLSEPDESKSLSESLKTDEYEIVGIVSSPMYIGYERDKTTVGSGTVDSNIFILEDDFVSDYYTEVYLRIEGTDEYEPFSDEYKSYVEEKSEAITEAFERSVNERYSVLLADAEADIESAESEAEEYEALLNSDYDTLVQTVDNLQAQLSVLDSDSAEYSAVSEAYAKASTLLEAIRSNDEVVLSEMGNELVTAQLQIASAKQELSEMAEPVVVSYDRFDSSDYSSYSSDSERIDNISKVFPVFFIIVAALVCLTTMTRMVDEKRVEIGTYKALGYSGFRIAEKYLVYAFCATIIGCTVGMAISFQLFPKVIFNAYKMLYNIPKINTPFKWSYYILCTLCALAVTLTTVIVAIKNELRQEPSQIMRPKSPPAGKRVILEKIPIIWNKISFLSKVTVRNLLRYKKRFLMSVVGVAGCTALIIAGFGLKYSISSIVDKQYGEVFLYDATASVNTDSLTDEAEIESAIGEYSEVDSSCLQSIESLDVYANDNHQSAYVTVPQDTETYESLVALNSADTGDPLSLSDGEVLITNKLSQLLGVETGDKITIASGLDEVSVTVTGIVENYAMHYIYMSPTTYEREFGESVEYNSVCLTLNDGTDKDDFSAALIASGDFLGISYTEESGESFTDSMDSLDIIIWVLIICAGALAIVVLYNLANINITERVREIATIKVLGFYDGEVAAYIYRENVISCILGILLGFVMGVFLHKFVVSTSEVDLVMFNRELVWWAYALGALLTILFAVAVNFVLYFKLSKIKMVESLKSVE